MIRAFRRTRVVSLFVFVTLLSTVPVTVSSLLHDDTDDAICNPTLVVHDQSAHRIGTSASSIPAAHHCVICHNLQSLRAALTATRLVAPTDDIRPLTKTAIAGTTAAPIAHRLGRAPPFA